MSTLEQTILAKVQQLTPAQQQQVLDFLHRISPPAEFDYDEWFQQVRAFKATLRERYGQDYAVGVQSLLDRH